MVPVLFSAIFCPLITSIAFGSHMSSLPFYLLKSWVYSDCHACHRISDLLLTLILRYCLLNFYKAGSCLRNSGLPLWSLHSSTLYDLKDRGPDELWNEVRDIVQETGIKTTPMEKKCKKAKWLSGEALQIAVKRREAKSKGEKKKYKHLDAELVPKNSKKK